MKNTIFIETLEGYSEGELRSKLPIKSLEFIENTFQKKLERRDLAKLVISGSILDFFFDKKNRNEFIEKMTPQTVSSVLKLISLNIDIPAENITSDTYEKLKEYSSSNIDAFLEIFGFNISDIQVRKNKKIDSLINITPIYPLYKYQRDLVKRVSKDIAKNPHNKMLLHLPTGAGKTRTAINIVSSHLRDSEKTLVIWITASNELCNQAVEEFSDAWKILGSHKLTCYKYFDKHGITLGGIESGFLVASIQQLYIAMNEDNSLQFKSLSENCSLLIFDEAHQCIAPTYKSTVDSIKDSNQNTYMLGLTATPGRGTFEADENDKALADYFGQNKVTMVQPGYESPVQYLIDEGYLSQPSFKVLEYTIPSISKESMSSLDDENAIYELSLVDDRNSAIIQIIEDEHSNGSYIIVFACNVEHAISLSHALNYIGIAAVSLTSSFDKDSNIRREKIDRYKSGDVRVIVNYGILTTGFDAPKTNVAIIARPTKSLVLYSQMVGRAMRGYKSGGNKNCRIYTVNDDIKQFKNVNYAFINWNKNYNEND